MTVAEILTELVNHGFEDETTEQKLFVINDTLYDIESREPWPFLEKTTTLDFNGTSPTPTNMPADYKAVLWLFDNSNLVSLWPERLSTVRDRFSPLTTVSDPTVYYFVGTQLRLYPTPGVSTGRYQLDYVATQQEVGENTPEADILLPKRHHRAIVLGALHRLYYMEDDPENGQIFDQKYEERLMRMHEDVFRRQYQRADQIFVIDEDDEWMF
jgi:hypothetical protein